MKFKSIDNNSNNKSDINWADIFLLDEFQQYVEVELVLKLSILSSSIRSKLKKLIFKDLFFPGYKFSENESYFKILNNSTDLFTEHLKFVNGAHTGQEDKIDLIYCNSSEIEAEIELSIERLKNDIKVYNSFVKYLTLIGLDTIGYYIFPTFLQFTNLTSLVVFQCSISFSSYCAFNCTLNGLKNLALESVIFVLSSIEKFEPERLILGNKLNTLTIGSFSIFESDSTSEAIKFIFNTSKEEDYEPFQLPLITVPSLRELSFSDHKINDDCLSEFLLLNPQLTSLVINHSILDQSVLNILKSSTNLSDLSLKCSGTNPINWKDYTFSKLQSIKNLKIDFVSDSSYEFINSLIVSCKSLKTLKYELGGFLGTSKVMSSFLSKVIPKLPHMDYLSFDTSCDYNVFPIDLKSFNSINHLSIEIYDEVMMLFELPKVTNLKKITIGYFGDNAKEEDIKQKFESYTNWSCKVKNQKLFLNYV